MGAGMMRPHSEGKARIFDAAVWEADANVIQQHSTREQARVPDFTPRHDSVLSELRHAPRREALAVREALPEDLQDVAPVLGAGRVAHVPHPGAVDRRDARNGPEQEPIYRDESPKEDMQNR